jgi:osomolarity two-component system sensor histidine kinase SLN1
MVRIGIRAQLAVAVLLCAFIPLMVLSVAVWINNHDFVVSVTKNELALTASLKAAQIASNLLIIQSTCSTIASRILLQNALKNFYKNPSGTNFTNAQSDLQSALASGGFSSLLQTVVFSRNTTGDRAGIMQATAANQSISTGTYGNGTLAYLGDMGTLGFPSLLYPNITYTTLDSPDPMDPSVNATRANAFLDYPLNKTAALLLGPMSINSSYAMVSLTLPISDNTNPAIILGFMTVVAAATSIISVTQSREGLANTGVVLLVGPSRRENHFKYEQRPATTTYTPTASNIGPALVHYVLPPSNDAENHDRHIQYT